MAVLLEKGRGGAVDIVGAAEMYAAAAEAGHGHAQAALDDLRQVHDLRAMYMARSKVRELAKVARKELADPDKASEAAVLFVVVRADVDVFRPNAKACPSFAKHIAKARADGVKVRARRVRWVAEGGGTGSVAAYDDGDLEVVL